MASCDWRRGGRIMRSAPWPPLLGSAGAAAVLLFVAVLAHRTGLTALTALLGLAACGAAAAHSLDEESTQVADASPTSRRRRAAWRLPVVGVPMAVALCGLFTLDRLDPDTHWLRLLPLAAGAIGIGVGLAAVLRHSGTAAPGELAGVVTLVGTVLVVAVDPLRRWIELLPLGDAAHPGRSVTLWIAVVGACAVVTLACTRDPGRRGPSRHRTRAAAEGRAGRFPLS